MVHRRPANKHNRLGRPATVLRGLAARHWVGEPAGHGGLFSLAPRPRQRVGCSPRPSSCDSGQAASAPPTALGGPAALGAPTRGTATACSPAHLRPFSPTLASARSAAHWRGPLAQTAAASPQGTTVRPHGHRPSSHQRSSVAPRRAARAGRPTAANGLVRPDGRRRSSGGSPIGVTGGQPAPTRRRDPRGRPAGAPHPGRSLRFHLRSDRRPSSALSPGARRRPACRRCTAAIFSGFTAGPLRPVRSGRRRSGEGPPAAPPLA